MHRHHPTVILILAAASFLAAHAAEAQDFRFDTTISRPVLESYLSRSISFTELLHDDLSQARNVWGVDPHDNIRLLLASHAKFVGRTLMLWGGEDQLDKFLKNAKPFAEALHQSDPEMVLQAAEYEIVTPKVETVIIPPRVFQEFGLPVEQRTFRYRAMLYANGTFMDHWEKDASVPDMSRLETRMWFYFLATAYIDVGIEAIHFGQAGLMDLNDPNHAAWLEVLGRVRSYAHEHARRHLLICDAHAPKGGFVENGKLLFDFHSFPLRISEVPDKPWTGVLNVGYTDSIVQRSMGGITPSGWSCDHLPYLVEFDNFSVSDHPGRPAQWPFIWGWDEITWFALKPEAERDAWLRYAWDWLARTDPNGHLEMPGSRAITPERPGKSDWYYANTKSFACPSGYNTEDTIKAIWGPIRQPPANAGADLARFINPFIGTDRDGNTFPGSVSPFGSVQFTPNLAGNGYYYPDTHMHGFVVNHMSGDGGANEGEVLMTATTGPVRIDRASTDYHFDHDHESASAGYYQVLMQPWKINAELTTTVHCGFARFTFPAGQQGNILLPLSYVNNPPSLSSHVRYVDGRTVEGDVDTVAFNGLHQGITVYFAMKFSKPFEKHGTWTNTTLTENSNSASQDDRETIIGFYGSYPAADAPQEVDVRVGVSYVDAAGARANLDAEMPADDFERYHQQAVADWNKELHLIDAEGGTFAHHRIFYTALYHCLIDPQIADDVDGRYRGFDDQIHHVPEGHQHFYTTFSGWDIYRSEIPLLTIIEPERVQDMAQSLVEEYEQIGYIDRWSQRSRPTAIMNGDPLTICLVNIWNAGLHNFDINTAYEAMFKQCVPGDIHSYLTDYELYEEEKNGITINPDAAVATALEHELAFAALGNLARSLDKPRDAAYLFGRSLQYREMYNPATGFLQRRDREGRWDPGFGGYTEGDEWIYLWFVNHDVQGLVDLLGGTTAFDRRLDEFFNDKHYDPTNEPDLQAPFLYDYINRPWKTQHLVAETADKVFTDSPGGLADGGNDDLGTMSAWYVLSQLGFYPVDPGIPDLEVCTPRFPNITVHLAPPYHGKEFLIQAPAASTENEYIQSSILNGKLLTKPWFPQSEITDGGLWVLKLEPKPDTRWAASPADRPYSLSTGYNHFPKHPILHSLVQTGEAGPQPWRFTTEDPGLEWFKTDFSDADWKEGLAGFGDGREKKGETRTAWKTNDIWMRRTFVLGPVRGRPAIQMLHAQAAEVYINGILAVDAPGSSHFYASFPMSPEAVASLHPGENMMAVHVHHEDFESHFADVGMVEVLWSDAEMATEQISDEPDK